MIRLSSVWLQAQVKKEADARKQAEFVVVEAKERITVSEGELQRLSGNFEREKKCLQKEILHLQDESKLSISRMTADVSERKCLNNKFILLFDHLTFCFPLFS